jgi:hypothetical protein
LYVRFTDGTQAQLSDWKAIRLYYQDNRFPTVEELLDVTGYREILWHVGGTDPRAVKLVSAAVAATRAAGDARWLALVVGLSSEAHTWA